MFGFTVLVLALAACRATAQPSRIAGTVDDQMRNILNAGLDFMRAEYARDDPFTGMEFKIKKSDGAVANGMFKGDLTFDQGQYSGFTNVVADVISTDSKELTAKLRFTFPKVELTGNYLVDGELNGHHIHGQGKIRCSGVNWTVEMNKVKLFESEDKALRVRSLGISGDIADLFITTTGLSVVNTTVSEIEKFIGRTTLKGWKSLEPKSSTVMEKVFIESFNHAVGNRSAEEVVQWLKQNKETPSEYVQNAFKQFIPVPPNFYVEIPPST